MVQFNLPKNSKILKGQYFKDSSDSKNLKIVHIYRWDPEKNENPREDTFEVNLDSCGNKVLDILIKIKNEMDTSLTFRKSCAHGVCGSCAMNVDGVNTLSCMKSHKEIKGDIRIFPLPHLKVVKDLVPDLSTLYKQYESIQPWLKTRELKSKKNKEQSGDMAVELVPHTDEMYRIDPPAITLFHVMVQSEIGGDSTLVDGLRLAQRMEMEHPDELQTLCKIPARFHRELEEGRHFDLQAPIFRRDEEGMITGIRLNDRCMAPVDAEPENTELFYDALRP